MNLSTLIRWIYYLLFFLTPLLMSSATSEIFELNKMMFIYFCTAIIVTLWGISMVLHKKPLLKSRVLVFLLLFILSQLLSTIFSIDKHTSLFGYYSRFNGGLISIFTYAALLFVFLQIGTKDFVKNLLKVSIFSSLTVMLWGLPGKFGYDFSCLLFTGQFSTACWTNQFQPEIRMFSTLGQPNWMGAYLAIHVFIGLYFVLESLLQEKGDKQSWQLNLTYIKKLLSNWSATTILYSLYTVLSVICIYFTSSRSSLLAVLIGFVFLGYILIWKYYQKVTQVFIAGIVAAVLAVGIYVSTLDLSSIKPTGITESLDIRKVVWKGAVDLGLQYPLFGTGVETFAYSYYFTRPIEHNFTSEWDFLYNKAHNEFLNYFATTGFLGLIAYLAFITYVMWFMIQKVLHVDTAQELFFYLSLIGGYVTIHVTNFFGFSTTTVQLFFYVIPAMMMAWELSQEKSDTKKTTWPQYIGAGAIGLIGLFILLQILQYRRADVLYAQANGLMAASDYQNAITYLDEALKLSYEHVYEDKLSVSLASLAYLLHSQDGKEQKDLVKQLVTLSNAYNEKTRIQSPQNILYWKTKAKNEYLFYEISKDRKNIDAAIEALAVAQKIAPTDPKLLHSEAVFYTVLARETKDPEKQMEWNIKAVKKLDMAISLKPNYDEAIIMRKTLQQKNP